MQAGTFLGPYEIVAAIGAGGMGEVYRARDRKLNRDVAIKVLPPLFAADPDRLARFEREAQALAALNHPNIAHVYGLETQEGRDRPPATFIVMEFVEGEELALRTARGPIPFDEAMPIAAQIADALEAAHERGIIHRDLKPANIKITTDGTVKVLDFGLAKATDATTASSANASMSPTLSVHATQAGLILGTAAYMSPEQARGKPVDKRADIWAFGVVLYEMVTGHKPFRGDDVGDVLAAVIKDEPTWDRVPARVRRLLQRCLQKDPKKRLRDISGVALLLEEPAVGVPPRASRLPWIAAGTLAVVAAVGIWAPWRVTRREDRPLVRLDVDLGSDVLLGSPQGAEVIVSPDGRRLLWASRGRLFTRRLDQPKALELAGTEGAAAPFISPDGQWVAFFAGGKLKKVSAEGGAAITLCDAPQGRGGTWSEDGRIIASLDGIVLTTISDGGGTPSPLTEAVQEDVLQRWPHVLPGSRAVLFTVRTGSSFDEANVDVLSLADRRRKTLVHGGTFGRYVGGSNGEGHLVYVSKGTLFAVPFDASRLEMRGTPSPVLEEVRYNNSSGAAQFDVSRTEAMVYRPTGAATPVSLHWLDATGKTQPFPLKPAPYGHPRLSPDGRLLAVSIAGTGGRDIWVYDWQRDAMSRLTFGGETYSSPVWSPDGRFIVFARGVTGISWTRADGAGTPEPLTQSKNPQVPWSFSPDGKRLAFVELLMTGGDIWTIPVAADGRGLRAGTGEPFMQTATNENYPAFSPDGRWIAYQTSESGTGEIQVRAFPDQGGKWLVSNGSGAVPQWSPNGRELFYRNENQQIIAVTYTVKGDVFVPDKPRLWSDKRLAESAAGNLDIAPDGKRFVTMMPVEVPSEQNTQSQVTLLLNFSDELRRRFESAK